MRSESALKTTKLHLRMRPLQKDVIARAAASKQKTVANFMIEQAFHAAQQILAVHTHFYLSPEKWDEFRAALGAPPRKKWKLENLLTEPSVFDQLR